MPFAPFAMADDLVGVVSMFVGARRSQRLAGGVVGTKS